jgi:hypothetical protein
MLADEELEDDFDDDEEDDDGDICSWCGADIGAGEFHDPDCDAINDDEDDDDDEEEDVPA